KGNHIVGFSISFWRVKNLEFKKQTPAEAWIDRSPHTTHFIKVNGVRLHYLDWGGKGEVLLFLPGLSCTAHIFDDLAPQFTDHFHVLALTRRGFGQSDKPAGGYDTRLLVQDIVEFLDALKINKVTLVGHSMAGDELTWFAAMHPERVRKLVYLDAAYDGSTAPPDDGPDLKEIMAEVATAPVHLRQRHQAAAQLARRAATRARGYMSASPAGRSNAFWRTRKASWASRISRSANTK